MQALNSVISDKVSIRATVKNIIFKNLQNDYYVVRFKSNNIPDFTGTGQFYQVRPGQCFVLHGSWVKTKYKGELQFSVERVENIVPEDLEDIIEYLGGGLFPGIGPSIARDIVRKFKEDTMKIVQNTPMRLVEVKGISSAKVAKIIKAYEAVKSMEELVLKLKPYGIPNRKIHKLFVKYGDKTLDMIIENPYCLYDEGIPFKVTDTIGKDCKVHPNDENRIRTGIFYALSEQGIREGHVYLPFGILTQKVKDILQAGEISGDVDRNEISRIVTEMKQNKELVIEDWLVYFPEYYSAEKYCGEKIKSLLSKRSAKQFNGVNSIIAQLETEYGMNYAEKQKDAFRFLHNGCFVITGGPGTGKTTIIKGIINIYKRSAPAAVIKLAAPTGRAAKRLEEATGLEAKTLHRLLEYRGDADKGIVCGKNEQNPITADVVIVDESSMMDLMLFCNLLKAVTPATSLIFVGDADQLPSVGAGNVLKDLIESERVPVVELNEIFRQANTSKIIVNANKINCGETDLEYGEDFVFIESEDLPQTILSEFVKELNRIININELQIITPLRKKTESGADNLNEIIQKAINPKSNSKGEIYHGKRIFRKYDKVMQFKNNYDKDVYNGDIGIIQQVLSESGTVQVLIDSSMVEYTPDDIEELQLAYAMSVHKSQGCEYDTIIFPLSMQHKRMLQRNLLYTGITRAKKKVILVGSREALNLGINNNKIAGRFSRLKNKIREA